MFAAIIAALGAFVEASKDFKLLVSTYQKYQDSRWKEALNEIKSKLNGPLSPEDKADAAKKLADLLARI